MPPKKQKGGVVIDGIDTTPMTREQLEVFALRIKEENEREREERNFFQLERDKLRTFWEITRNELDEARAKLRNKDRQIEEERDKNHDELKFYKQKVKHLQFEHQESLTDCKAEAMVSLKNALVDHDEQERELLRDKLDLKHHNKDQDYCHQEQIKSLKLQHSEDLCKEMEEFHEKVVEIESKYEKKFNKLQEELGTKHKMEMFEVEERKSTQIDQLTKNHDKAYNEMKNYYNDITLNNLAVIKSLKGQMETLRKQNEWMTRHVKDLATENQRMAQPLKMASTEVNELNRQLANYAKDKISLTNTHALLCDTKKKLSELTWTNEALELRYEKLQAERNELHKKFVKAVLEVQQKTSLKTELLSKRIEALNEKSEAREFTRAQLQTGKVDSNKSIDKQFEKVLQQKNRQIKDLQYELARICRAHDDMLATYEEKLVQYGIPKHELGFTPLRVLPDGQSGLARNPAGLITSNR